MMRGIMKYYKSETVTIWGKVRHMKEADSDEDSYQRSLLAP